MPHIGVLFEIRSAETRPGELVSVVGGRPELSDWDPFDFKTAAGLQLRTGASQYPSWAMSAPVWIQLERGNKVSSWSEPGSSGGSTPVSSPAVSSQDGSGAEEVTSMRLEYKYVKDRRQIKDCGPSIQWEDSIANRRVTLPQEHGSIWIVSDHRFNEAGEPRITRTSLLELLVANQDCQALSWPVEAVFMRRGDIDPEWTSHRDPSAPEWAGSDCEELSSPGSVETTSSHHTTSTVFFF